MKLFTPAPNLPRPKEHAVNQILTMIINNTLLPGSPLPAERELAEKIGVTRQTLREVLQRLETEGWITISHGKSTVINDYWQEGGQAILSSIARHVEHLPEDFIRDLTEYRIYTAPIMMEKAADRHPDLLLHHLCLADDLEDTAVDFVAFDWRLHWLAARYSGNKIFPLQMNDYKAMFQRLGLDYFSYPQPRQISLKYYHDLTGAISTGSGDIKAIVEAVMRKVLEMWVEIRADRAD